MKRAFEFFTYIFYRYYDKGSTQSIAYESALLAISLIIFMNLLALLILLGLDPGKYLPIIENRGRVIKLLSGFLIFIPLFIILRILLPRKVITQKQYSDKSLKIGGLSIILYIILSMVLLVILAKNKDYFLS